METPNACMKYATGINTADSKGGRYPLKLESIQTPELWNEIKLIFFRLHSNSINPLISEGIITSAFDLTGDHL